MQRAMEDKLLGASKYRAAKAGHISAKGNGGKLLGRKDTTTQRRRLSNPNIAYGWVNSAPANDLGLALVPEVAGRVAVQVQASPCTEGGLDYTEQEEDFHRRGQGQVEEVEEPDRVAELVGVADEEQQLVGDLVDSCP